MKLSPTSFRRLVVADDLGASPGVNRAIAQAYSEGGLTHSSIMVNAPYFRQAMEEVVRPRPHLNIGLHLNLTTGTPSAGLAAVPSLVGPDGCFRHGFFSLWKATTGRDRKDLIEQIGEEISAQILQAQAQGLRLTHLDGHRHVHLIPLVYEAVKELAARHGIPRVRIINESLAHTLQTTRAAACLFHPNLLKYFLLKRLCRVQQPGGEAYFFSILFSCRLTPRLVARAQPPPGWKTMEVMVHPGDPEIDRVLSWDDPIYRAHLVSPFRTLELKACLEMRKDATHEND